MSTELWRVAVDAPLRQVLTYISKPELAGLVHRGVLVQVPLGKRHVRGIVLSEDVGGYKDEIKYKAIDHIVDEYPPLPEFFLKWLEWLAQYYVHPPGSVLSLAYPPLKKGGKSRKGDVIPTVEPQITPPQLTPEQKKVFEDISSHPGFEAHLLFGVTGSGKTEVYLRLLEEVLAKGKRGLVLVPEISLTPQLIQRFVARFGDKVAALHSKLTDRERTNQWWDIVDNNKSILIGARSALFCPIDNLGIIIVDEEHEPSYKQEEKLKYHGRDAAIMQAKNANCPIVLGSATPSLESWKNAIEGKYKLHKMQYRVELRALPQLQILDMRDKEKKDFSRPPWLSQELHEAMITTLDSKKQVALFLNRRGMAQMVLCPACGFVHECPNCDIALTLHGKSHMVCHYCDYHENFKVSCPSCKEGELTPVGLGTEHVEEEIQRLFPDKTIARADRDEIQSRDDLEDLITRMETGEIDILIGTQMIAKGLDFEKLQLVGLLLADIGFNIPDFRSTERSFQLVTQVSGRAGRHVKEGEAAGQVIVQTYNPEHPSLTFAQQNDFEGFAEHCLREREPLGYPPYGKLVSFRIQGPHLSRVQETARLLSNRCHQLKEKQQAYQSIEVLGPAEAPLSKLRGQFRYHLLLKGPDHRALNAYIIQVLNDEDWIPAGIKLGVDVDPLHLL